MSLASNHLDAFVAVAQIGNFTLAAKRLNVTQSALSQRILNLEEELGTTLFIRERSGLLLTETAHDLLRYCTVKEALETEFIEKLKTRSQKDLVGVIRVAGTSSLMRSIVLPALAPLLTKHIGLRLELKTRESGELAALLLKGEVDFILTDRRVDRSELDFVQLGTERYVLAEQKGYAGPETYLDHDEDDLTTLHYLKQAKKKVTRIERRYLDDIYGVLDGLKAGFGRAVVPEHLIHKQNDLRILNPEVVMKVPIFLQSFKQPYYSRLHEATMTALELGFAPLR